mgnify:CR=1 FL=1
MKGKSLKGRLRPHLWYQAYWFVYLIWFFTLDALVQDPKYIIHSPLDDYIPFNEWFVFPYCSWFVLLALVLALLWWNDTPSYDRLCLSMFSGMSLCLILYMLFPNGLQLRPDPATLGRDNPALWLMRLLWAADSSNNVCPSIHCQSTGCMALAMWYSSLAYHHRWIRPVGPLRSVLPPCLPSSMRWWMWSWGWLWQRSGCRYSAGDGKNLSKTTKTLSKNWQSLLLTTAPTDR